MNQTYFLGANTPDGFHSHYDSILNLENCRRLYIIKGGPGTGKSTLMKRVASFGRKMNLAVDTVFCSGDPDSLDAVVFPEQGIAILDGTAPHVVEPQYPGCVETVIDLSSCWDNQYLRSHRKEIVQLFSSYKASYQDAYGYLLASKKMRNRQYRWAVSQLDFEKMQQYAISFVEKLHLKSSVCHTVNRYIQSPTCMGTKHFKNEMIHTGNRAVVIEDCCDTAGLFLATVRDICISRNIPVQCYFNGMNEELGPWTLFFPDDGVSVLVSDENAPLKSGRKIRMLRFMKRNKTKRPSRSIENKLYQSAISSLAEAKKKHDMLEKYYSAAMDFEAVADLGNRVLTDMEQILQKSIN